MASDTCPHCGAARPRVYDTGTQWACLSWQMNDGSEIQSKDCRIREVKLLRNQLATVTAERDDWRDTAAAMMTAACGTDDIDEQERMCNANGTKPSQFVAALKAERDELRRRIDEAGECIDQFCVAVWAYGSKSERDELEKLTRLVRDDQPTVDAPESSPHSL